MAEKLNDKIFKEALKYLVGGVNSPVRAFGYVGGRPIPIRSGKGSRVRDYDGKEYIDYVLYWGAAVLGHSHPSVTRDVKKTIDRGLGFGATYALEVELAKEIARAIPFIKKIRFVNSGTEAVMGAIRLARGYTGRNKIVKFENAYHGHADYMLVKGGSGLATLGMPSSAGVPESLIKDTIIAPAGDAVALSAIFKIYGKQIAAVIIEPVGGNYGVLPPDTDFLKKLRRITKRYGALLIFDEVITGFRFGYGSAAQTLGITPDLICLGKIIGGGLPIGAYGGRKDIMGHLAPVGKVYQASTFSGNPVVMRAGLSTLGILKRSKKEYERIKRLARYLSSNIAAAAGSRGIVLEAPYYGTMFSFKFADKTVFSRFYRRMLARGIYFAPSEFEANFLSLAHTKNDIDRTIAAAREALSGSKGRV